MQTVSALATRFGRKSTVYRSDFPLAEDQMRATAPFIFAVGKHDSRSERYTYIPTIEVLRALRHEGFEPFMVAQSASRTAGKSEFTKHMIRMRHAEQAQAKSEAHEIILINSHDRCQLVPNVGGNVPLRLLQRAGGRRHRQRHPHPAQRPNPRSGD